MNTAILIVFGVIFFGILIAIGLVTKKWSTGAADFVISGRETSWFVSTTSICAIAFAGTTLSLAPGFAISHGFTGALSWMAVLCFGSAFYAILYAKPLYRCGSRTLSEWMETRYDGRVRTITAIGTVIGLCGVIANNIASFAQIFSTYGNVPYIFCVLLCFIIMIIFTYCSGMHAVNMTNLFQMLIGVIAIPMFAILLWNKFGGIAYLNANWPGPGSWLTSGVTGKSMPIFSVKYPSVLTFFFLNGIFLTWGSNYYYLRVVCCRSEKVAKRSYIASAFIKIIITALPMAIVGLFAATANPGTFAPIGKVPSSAAYGLMLVHLAAATAAFMLVASMAASLSTASTGLMGASSSAARDIYQRNFKANASDREMLWPNRLIMVIIGAFTCLLCFFPGGPTYLFAFSNSWMAPPAVLLCLGVFWPRFTAKGAFWGCISGIVVLAVLTILGDLTSIFVIGKYMHVSIPGLGITLIVSILVSSFSQPKYYGKKGWNKDPAVGQREKVNLEQIDLQILGLLRNGFKQMVELSDYLGLDNRFTTRSIERLDRGGYLQRDTLSGAGFYCYTITDKGKSVLPTPTAEEQELSKVNLTPMFAGYLKETLESEDRGIAFLRENNIRDMQVVAINAVLSRSGYIGQRGILRRHYFVTEKGLQLCLKGNGIRQRE